MAAIPFTFDAVDSSDRYDAAQSSHPYLYPNTAEWDEAIARFPATTVFHKTAWLLNLQETYRYRLFLTALKEKQSTRASALLPVLEVDSSITGRRGVALPFSDLCPLLASHEEAARTLVSRLINLGRTRRWRTLEIRGHHPAFQSTPVAERYYGHQLALGADEKTLFDRLESAHRRAIRKACRQNVSVVFAKDPAALRTFYELFCLTRRRHGLPPPPLAFFSGLQRNLLARDLGVIVLAIHSGRAVAGAVFLRHATQAYYKYGASDDRFQHLRANNLAMWEAIKWHAGHGFSSLDFGRTDLPHEGLRRFKLGWGAKEYAIEYYRYDFRRSEFSAATASRPDARIAWSGCLFRHLPLTINRSIGRLLYRHLG